MKNKNYDSPVFEIISLDEDVVTNSPCTKDLCPLNTICGDDWDLN